MGRSNDRRWVFSAMDAPESLWVILFRSLRTVPIKSCLDKLRKAKRDAFSQATTDGRFLAQSPSHVN